MLNICCLQVSVARFTSFKPCRSVCYTIMSLISMSKLLGLLSKSAAASGSTFCKLCIPYLLHSLAASLGEGSLNVARCLRLQQQSICWIDHEHKSDFREMAFQLLHTWYIRHEHPSVEIKTLVQRLAQALHEGGREDLAVKLIRHKCKCNLEEVNRNEKESKGGCCPVHCAGKCTIL